MTLPGGDWEELDAYLTAAGVRIGAPTLGGTTGGKHAPTSFHYKPSCSARDYGQSRANMRAVLVALLPYAVGANCFVVELYGLDTFYRGGRKIVPSAALRNGHQDHVHASLRPGSAERFRARWMADLAKEDDVALVDVLADPLAAKDQGGWALLEDGTVRPFRGARDLGQPKGHDYWGNRKAKRFEPSGGGYAVIATSGERYDYP